MKQSETVEICFDDLRPDKQRILLDAFEIENPLEMNWDCIPLCILYADKETKDMFIGQEVDLHE